MLIAAAPRDTHTCICISSYLHTCKLRGYHFIGVLLSMCQEILIILILDKSFWECVKVAWVCTDRECALISACIYCVCVFADIVDLFKYDRCYTVHGAAALH